MLPVLVLLVATSALAAPGVVRLNQVSSNNVAYSDNSLVGRAFEAVDDGDVTIGVLNAGAVLKDLSRQGGNQAFTNGLAATILAQLSAGNAGDACAAADYINAYARYLQTGSTAGVRESLANYIRSVIANIANVDGLVNNRAAVRSKTSSRGGCAGGGRTYQIEPVWDVILGSVSDSQSSLVGELYSVVKRLYCGFSAANSNAAATLTAAALPPTTQLFELSANQLADLLSSVGSRGNVAASANNLQQALSSNLGRVRV